MATIQEISELQTKIQTLINQTAERIAMDKKAAAEAVAGEKAVRREVDATAKAVEKQRLKQEAYNNDVGKMTSDAVALQQRINTALSSFSKASGTSAYQSIAASKTQVDQMLSGVQVLDRAQLNNLIANFDTCVGRIKSANLATKSFGDAIATSAKKFMSWFGITQTIMYTIRYLKQMVTNVVEIDTAMTSLRRVTNETEVAYSNFMDSAISRTKTLGATLADTINATVDFSTGL